MAASVLDPGHLIGACLADNRFRIVARVGAGSMAIVYRAFDYRLETEVVVKVPRKEKLQDPDLRERFRRESRLLVQLQHPHIVGILDVGVHQEIPYVVMPYLSGGTLLDRMQSGEKPTKGVPVDSIRQWLPEVAKALDFAHGRMVVHRDVKPANILFDESGNAFLSDFGLTKIMYGEPSPDAPDETAAGYVVGTPNFVAPEVVLGKGCDGRSDQYSLGLTVYQMLIGMSPMMGKTPGATLVNQTRRLLPLVSEIRKSVPQSAALAIARSISKRPEDRFESCGAFAEAVVQGLRPATSQDSIRDPGHSTTVAQVGSTRSQITLPSAIPVPRVSRSKTPGLIPCPGCSKPIRLRPEYAGRNGKCSHCQLKVAIGTDLQTLTERLSGLRSTESGQTSDKSSPSSASNNSQSAEDLVLSDRLFGFQLGRKAVLVIGITVIAVIVAVSVWLAGRMNVEKSESDRAKEFRNSEG
ncbi:MAG: serine/threonine protein kinase [Planctomycetaceae bacterium]|nr:serine/threonine protein kinase [Planctomycetaceae bacterium]